ncbi:MAG TPA: sodium:solute symporter family protein, partial [Tepidisphaeraceae bacterium]|nr:sodium:solute symporter family protein [Tepidisphaeraceae bacterium]
FTRRSSKSTAEFFASGRSVPWWLAGISMVATTFSADTPNLVAQFVRQQGVAGNWQWWAFVLTGVATVFFYARLWRRSAVLTDLEFYELRYSGWAAGVIRGFRAVYLGLLFNCLILATVSLAACKIAAVLFNMKEWQTLLLLGGLNVVFAAESGLWGVLVIDMIQFFIKMTAVIAAAYFAVIQPQVGGLRGLVRKLSARPGPHGLNYLNMLPDFRHDPSLAMTVFIMPIAVQWWAVWYPGSEPGGGSYIAQRMLASKSEKDSLGSVLFFNVAHYVLRPWPWILVGLASLLVYPNLSDIQAAFPHVDHRLIADDIAFPAMLKFLPVGFVGLMVGGLIAAASSTILTHLNWGSSYLVHDFYRRFIRPGKSEKHYVGMGRVATMGIYVCAALLTLELNSARQTFNVILQIGAGTGLLYLVRWFWWRVNAWCEVTAMVSSFLISVVWFVSNRQYGGNVPDIVQSHQLIWTAVFTTVCWLAAAYLAPQTDRQTMIEFYRKVKPSGLGWEPIRREAGMTRQEVRATGDNFPLALVGWSAGCAAIWASLFAVGNFLYGRMETAWTLTGVFAVSGSVMLWVINRLWSGAGLASKAAGAGAVVSTDR